MGHKETDREIAVRFASKMKRVEIIDTENQGVRLSFVYTTPSISNPTRWKIWFSGYDRNLPWRTAKLEKFTDSYGGLQDMFTTHASHATLQEAFEWLAKLD